MNYSVNLLVTEIKKVIFLQKAHKMSKNQGVIQLMHPGQEPSRGQKIQKSKFYLKEWNTTDCHRRKYMYAIGDYLENGKLHINKAIHFWGEWEPESVCVALNHKGEVPKSLHTPIFIAEQDRKKGINILENRFSLAMGNDRLNTDPFVFGDTFYYTCCHISQLPDLNKGDILLFGSVKSSETGRMFLLDTVFVVDNTAVKVNTAFIKNNRIFYETVIAPAERYEKDGCVKKEKVDPVISGAMYYKGDKPFSFVPFKKADNGEFCDRLAITEKGYQKYLSDCRMCFNSQGFGYLQLNNNNDKNKFWNNLKDYCERQGYCLGVRFSLPMQVQNNNLDLSDFL